MKRQIVFSNSLFPCLSETFVFDQFEVLQHAGLDFYIVANHRPRDGDVHPRMRAIQTAVDYLSEASAAAVLSALWHSFTRHPWRFLKVIAQAPRSEETLKTTLAQIVGAALIIQRHGQSRPLHIHSHFTYGATAVALWAKRLAGIPYTITLHGSDLLFDQPADLGSKLREAAGIVSISQFNIDHLAQHYPDIPNKRIRLIRMGIRPLHDQLPPRPTRQTQLRILSVGRLSVHKAQHDLIDACARLRDQGIKFSCTIIGEGELRSALSKQIQNLKLEGQVELAGARYHDEVLAAYGQYDLFVLSSITEGQPLVLMEAMRAGIPVIATTISAIPELIQDGGCLVPPADPAALASAIAEFSRNPELALAKTRRAAEIVKREYDLRENHLRFKAYLEEFTG